MSNTPYLIKNRHGTVWVCLIVIPKDIRHLFKNRREFRRSTFTKSKSLAFLRASVLVHEFKQCCEEIGVMTKANKLDLSMGLLTTFDAFNNRHQIDFGGDKCPDAAEKERQEADKIRKGSFEEMKVLSELSPELVRARLNAGDPMINSATSEPEYEFKLLFEAYRQSEISRSNDPDGGLKKSTLEDNLPRIRLLEIYFGNRLTSSMTKKEVFQI